MTPRAQKSKSPKDSIQGYPNLLCPNLLQGVWSLALPVVAPGADERAGFALRPAVRGVVDIDRFPRRAQNPKSSWFKIAYLISSSLLPNLRQIGAMAFQGLLSL